MKKQLNFSKMDLENYKKLKKFIEELERTQKINQKDFKLMFETATGKKYKYTRCAPCNRNKFSLMKKVLAKFADKYEPIIEKEKKEKENGKTDKNTNKKSERKTSSTSNTTKRRRNTKVKGSTKKEQT